MSRAQFDSEQVIRNAMEVFWQNGYSGTSMQDVTTVTGLKPGSIYLAFGNKDGLYRAALEFYAQKSLNFIHSTIDNAGNVGKGICLILNNFVEQTASENFYSCFLVRSRLELPQQNALHDYAGELLQEIENCFVDQLSEEFGESNAKKYAKALMLQIFGIRVYGYHKNSHAVLREALVASLPWLPWPEDSSVYKANMP